LHNLIRMSYKENKQATDKEHIMAGPIGPDPSRSSEIRRSIEFAQGEASAAEFAKRITQGAPLPQAAHATTGAASQNDKLFGLDRANHAFAGFPALLALSLVNIMRTDAFMPSIGQVDIQSVQTAYEQYEKNHQSVSAQDKTLELTRKEADALTRFLQTFQDLQEAARKIQLKLNALKQA